MEHAKFIQRCLELAQTGQGNVSPNPMVGSVVVYEGRIIGEGYHSGPGKLHAEPVALNNVV
ncbi:MAG: riboflavin biosynthesis protein RibD, partial [Bacteroidota bacterium]|nr:riboflavin biosynthesis protein RibD [Bacteroidota bacterium]